jgi:hypothetical protein
MSIVLIVENLNKTHDEINHPIFLKAGLAKIYKIADKTTCHVDNKLSMCFDDNLEPFELPIKYTVEFKIHYDLNWLADQDGVVEENCTKAFVKQININESFTYFECAEEHIDFDNLLSDILNEVIISSLTKTRTTVENSLRVVQDAIASEHLIRNDKLMEYIDAESGAKRIVRHVTRKLFQTTVVNLNDGGYILDTLNLESNKEEAFGTLSLKIKAVTIDPEIIVKDENPPNINLDMETDCS